MCIIRVFDAFSGIGGFRSGLERAGNFSFVGWCEIDKFAQKAYRTLYDVGGEDFHENIRTTRGLADFDSSLADFPVSLLASLESDKKLIDSDQE